MKPLDILYVVISTALLVVNQIALKLWLINKKVTVWPINLNFFKSLFSLEIIISIVSIGLSGVLWLSLLKKIEFSVLYPMISLSYVFGVLAAVFIFKESVPIIRWLGIVVIMFGIFLITRN
jgi:drug/metabolite transporter (DMT)-like permease